jgi:hypothetical protein
MAENATIFDRQIDFDPGTDLETFARQAPAKWAVYLMSDSEDRPVQLLCVKNLRNSLKRRLGLDGEDAAPSKRVNYRELVRRVSWRRVDSAFEADWAYYEAARLVFPESYRGMVGFRPAWFIHINPSTDFPRYTKTIDLTIGTGELLGPLEDKHAAARLIQLMEDAFDLCRYHQILVQSPSATACAYKEMGKCPAPCDGSISLEQYRRLVDLSVQTLIDPAQTLRQQTARMKAAAAELQFESAAKIKAYVEQLSQLGKGPFRHVARLRDFCYLSLQHGPRPERGEAKVFLITPGRIEPILGLINEQTRPEEILRAALESAERRPAGAIDATGAERIGVVAHHLFSAKHSHGVFLRMDLLDEPAIAKGLRELRKQAAQKPEEEGEGVLKELQAM